MSGLKLEATGTWLNTSMYEIPTLAIVNEVYFRMQYDYKELYKQFKRKLKAKKKALLDGTYEIGNFSEFGLRRRLSSEAQDYAVRELKDVTWKVCGSNCVGTSNIYLARKYNVIPVGTEATDITVTDGICYVNLNDAFGNQELEYSYKLPVYSIVIPIMLSVILTF